MPVPLCVIRTAVSRLLTFCPPGPPERATVISSSFSGMCASPISGNSGSTSTSEKLVCRFPCPNGERRTRRCTPASFLRTPYTPIPCTSNDTLRYPPIGFWLDERSEERHPFEVTYFIYISSSMREKSSASSPPAPETIDTIAFPLS